MKKQIAFALAVVGLFVFLSSCEQPEQKTEEKPKFITINGPDLVAPDGRKFFIQGINLGNWLNPEGYMFRFSKAGSARLIDQAFREMVGPDFTDEFWKQFKDNYISREDIQYIKSTGVNSIRIPFHYKLFTDEDYMGLTVNQDGFQRIDSLIEWCRESELYLILDMHDAPGGQTGDNIDDSYGYPWLLVSEKSQELFVDIWKRIAEHYKDEPVILGYDLLNEPIATYFKEDEAMLNSKLEPLYIKAVKAIREVDTNHIVLLGGAQWNSNFSVFTDSKFDDKLMYTCHRYWTDTLQANIQDFVDFRDSVNLPIYMGETGENTNEWISAWTRLMIKNNIGYHYWPYKKMGSPRCMVTIPTPENWQLVINFTESSRGSYSEIRKARPDQEAVKKAMLEFLENCKFSNSAKNEAYIRAMGMEP
ncbi:cellulase family glycosylhydrolase [Maribellus comscasis]|uniref:Cellulase family glycosylhydrolase n=1 Tax=Maribellus comscasis TaxID=2681766 RepID=A0A6I6JRG0_9BACT|nr:glycoside hydrolase family 5 protein [Maribellus comscasis]QGY43648.1 cellulase family glycosylhydrolase [Maribellus comscasis]